MGGDLLGSWILIFYWVVGNVCATPEKIFKLSDNSRNYPPFSEYLYELCGIVTQLSPPEYAIFVKLSKNGYIFKKLIQILQILNTIYKIRANCQIICIFGLCTMKYIHVFKCTSKYNKIHRCILKYQDIHTCISIYIHVFICMSW